MGIMPRFQEPPINELFALLKAFFHRAALQCPIYRNVKVVWIKVVWPLCGA
jgi:hypothetical protein